MLPSGLLVGGILLVHYAMNITVYGWELPLLGVLAALPLVVESALLTISTGGAWRRLDPSLEAISAAVV